MRSGLKPKLSGQITVWSQSLVSTTVWSKKWSHPLSLASVKSRSGFTFLVPAYPGSPGQNPESHKMVCSSSSRMHLKVNGICHFVASPCAYRNWNNRMHFLYGILSTATLPDLMFINIKRQVNGDKSKTAKIIKGDITHPPSHRPSVNVMLSNITFLWFFAVFDPSPLHPDNQPSFISFFHLLQCIASFLFNLRTWHSICISILNFILRIGQMVLKIFFSISKMAAVHHLGFLS